MPATLEGTGWVSGALHIHDHDAARLIFMTDWHNDSVVGDSTPNYLAYWYLVRNT